MSFDQKEIVHLMYKLARISSQDSRVEHDSLGSVNVPLDRLFGGQTMRALMSFPPGDVAECMPRSIIVAMGILKKASAVANKNLGLDDKISAAILEAAEDVISGKLYDEHHFPLAIWQSGSGAHTNMNVNEVISNRAIAILGGQLGSKSPVHPCDHVNMSQNSNDAFASAINIAVCMELQSKLFPALKVFTGTLLRKEKAWDQIIKVGRTHLMDAEPLTLGQEFSGYRIMMVNCHQRLESAMERLHQIPIGGSSFASDCIKEIRKITALPITAAPNVFEAIGSRDCLIELHGELNSIAVSVMKIANDIRLMGSGPRCGFGELTLPVNEPGSSIMPGKVNPTQCEALTMICAQVMGNQVAVTVGGASGHFQLNDFMPLIASNVLRSIALLSDGMLCFTNYCLSEILPNIDKFDQILRDSLTLVTALVPHIGSARASAIANAAHLSGNSLKAEAIRSGIAAADFDGWVRPQDMLGPT